jgi:rhodanese-related sulfurtransferase
MSNVIDADWDSVMDAFRKGNQMRLAWVKEKRKRYQNIWEATGEKKTCEEILEIFKSGGFIIDVRNPLDYMSGGKIHNSVNVPLLELLNWCNANKHINKNTPILVYSDNGKTAQSALQSLVENNYANVTNIGTHKWYNLCS